MEVLTVGVQDPALRAREIALGSTFLRLFAPQVVFYGAGMIMTAALHAHRRFGVAAAAPIANNVVVIVVYVTYALMRGDRPPTVAGISAAETLVLGAGTTVGVVAMTAVLVPSLRRLGWRFRPLWRPGHRAVKRAARLGAWALGYAGGYQAGLVIVLLFANRVEGGVAAYQWAYTFFYVPHAVLAVPVFNVLFPAMSEHAARGEDAALAQQLRAGLGMLAFLLVPVASFMLITAAPVARATLQFGVMSEAGADLVARVLAAFALGLPTYSAFLALTRAAYALGDTKTPALVNAGAVCASSVTGAALFVAAPERWAVPGLALGHSVGFALGAGALGLVLGRRLERARVPTLRPAIVRSAAGGAVATAAMLAVAAVAPSSTRLQSVAAVLLIGVAGAIAYLAVMSRTRSAEMERLVTLLTPRRGRAESA
jgi:putative peptidoglycan lipid II flippase